MSDRPCISLLCKVFNEQDGHLFYRLRPARHFVSNHQCNIWNAKYATKEAGVVQTSKRGDKRCKITIRPFLTRRYHIVWALHKGEWEPMLDHKDGNSLNDRIENLRPATYSQNGANMRTHRDSTTGIKGVFYLPDRRLWKAVIRSNGVTVHLGSYITKDEAAAVYERHALRLNGEFARPHHTDHTLACTGSNASGQPGSAWA